MTKCFHRNCDRDKRIWVPLNNHSGADVKLHPWCMDCGVIKNISDDRGRKLGYWMNTLSKIAASFSLKQVQKRCIAKELASYEWFNDNYFISGSAQKIIFKNIVKKYCNINVNSIDSFFY
jgi:hypothetical protein